LCPVQTSPPFLPVSLEEAAERGWRELDIIFITGDAYVDHPSFAPALLGRMLEAEGFRVGIIARPRPDHPEDVARLGAPKLFFAVSPGSVDSMVNNYTAQKRPRRTDDYAPGGVAGGRPNRALIVYCNLLRRAFGKSAAILAGGVEASLRRFAHYDFWDDAVRRPVLLDAPADAIVYGMGERPIREIAPAMRSRMAQQKQGSSPAEQLAELAATIRGTVRRTAASTPAPAAYYRLPDFEQVRDNPQTHARSFIEELQHREAGTYQDCAGHRVLAAPPALPLTTAEMDALYDLPFRRQAHPSYKERVPALEQVQFSITSHRGCFGGCAFCGIVTHQGKTVQSRSCDSLLREVERIAQHPEFKGTIRDIGGPTANMWGMGCRHSKPCARPSCLAPAICRNLNTDGLPYVSLLDRARKVPGVKHLFITSGVRMDLALECEPFIEAFAAHYTSGHAKVAPEHVVPEVLELMLKPDGSAFLKFLEQFRRASIRARKEQYVLPYLIAAHPGSTIEHMIEVALFLKKRHLRVEQCQLFIPLPGTASAVMYAVGLNPYTMRKVFVEKEPRRREMQKALVLYHLPESQLLIEEALAIAGRAEVARDLLPRRGGAWAPNPQPKSEVPAVPKREEAEARRPRARKWGAHMPHRKPDGRHIRHHKPDGEQKVHREGGEKRFSWKKPSGEPKPRGEEGRGRSPGRKLDEVQGAHREIEEPRSSRNAGRPGPVAPGSSARRKPPFGKKKPGDRRGKDSNRLA